MYRTAAFSALFVLALSALASRSLDAFELIGRSWCPSAGSCVREVPFRVNPNFPDPALSGSPEEQVDILRCAARAWTDQSAADFEFVFAGTTTRAGFDLDDGVNTVSWVDDDIGDALAATIVEGFGSRATAFDIVFFSRTDGIANRWNGPQDPPSGTLDIAGVAVHEFGHALGLDHTDVRAATMFAAATNRGLPLRTLHDDDRAGVEFLYGVRSGADLTPALSGIDPALGPSSGGNEVVLSGKNFTWTADTTLWIDNTVVSRGTYEVENCGRIRIHAMPPHDPGTVSIRMVNELTGPQGVWLDRAYRYGDPPPVISSVEPALAPLAGGVEFVVRGDHFTSSAEVFVGPSAALEVEFIDPETVRAVAPPFPAPAVLDLRVVQGDDTAVLEDAFTYTAKILRVGRVEARPGETGVRVPVFASTEEPLSAVSFGFTYDAQGVVVNSVTVEGTLAEGAAFNSANIDNVLGVTTFGLVMDFFDNEPSIPPGEDMEIASIIASVGAEVEVGNEISIRLEDLVGSPPIELIFTPAGGTEAEMPFTIDGGITVVEGARFIRGDANGDDKVDLSDAIFNLAHLFQGGTPPACEDAADTNDDGRLDISDSVYMLIHLFSGGPPPAPPYPDAGFDPTPDALECES